ncbi:MAG: hypothetical protein IPI04_15910 [Ignavibacteria bacterium]|nr:hypothetical protein [Ignavibacteria bacterium]
MLNTGSLMFAGTGGNGIYKSINSGQNWTKTSMIAFYVPCLAQNGSTIFAGADNGVQYSTDNGLTWNETSFTNEIVFSMAFIGSTVFGQEADTAFTYLQTAV